MIIHNALLLLKIKRKHSHSFDGELLLLLPFLKIFFLALDRRLKIDLFSWTRLNVSFMLWWVQPAPMWWNVCVAGGFWHTPPVSQLLGCKLLADTDIFFKNNNAGNQHQRKLTGDSAVNATKKSFAFNKTPHFVLYWLHDLLKIPAERKHSDDFSSHPCVKLT